MGRTRIRRRKPHPDRDESVLEYFFVRGNPTHPRTEPVRRDELWGALEWFYRRTVRDRRWYRRLWRSIAHRLPVWDLDPFAWIRLQQVSRPAKEDEDADGRR